MKITKNTLSNNGEKTELIGLQDTSLKLKFEIKVKFHSLKPHPVFQVAKHEHKTSPAPYKLT